MNCSMRFRAGVLVSFGVGYVLGSKAGHERYEQLVGLLETVRDGRFTERIREALGSAVDRLRDGFDPEEIDLTSEPVDF